MFKTDGLGFEGMNTCSMVKARKHPKVKMRRWFGNRFSCMKKQNEIMVMPFGGIQYCLHALGSKCIYHYRNLKFKLQVSFALSAFLRDHDFDCDFGLLHAIWYYPLQFVRIFTIHLKIRSKDQQVLHLLVLLFTFHAASVYWNFFSWHDSKFSYFSIFHVFLCAFHSNKSISTGL